VPTSTARRVAKRHQSTAADRGGSYFLRKTCILFISTRKAVNDDSTLSARARKYGGVNYSSGSLASVSTRHQRQEMAPTNTSPNLWARALSLQVWQTVREGARWEENLAAMANPSNLDWTCLRIDQVHHITHLMLSTT
jgi:hypothetical protein